MQFSNIGHDLVVLDDLGLAHFFTCSTGLGRMNPSPVDFGQDRTARSDLDVVIGLHWLMQWPIEFKVRNLCRDVHALIQTDFARHHMSVQRAR